MYVREWTARFSHVDMFRTAYYPEIMRAVHDTADAFLEGIGFPFWTLNTEFGVGLPIVECGARFENPIRAGDTVRIELTHRAGESGLRFDFDAELADGTRAFTAFEQRACVPVGGESSTPLPDELRTALDAAE